MTGGHHPSASLSSGGTAPTGRPTRPGVGVGLGFAHALAAIAAGHDQAAHGNIQSAITAIQTGSADMAKATVDVNRYGAKRTGSRA